MAEKIRLLIVSPQVTQNPEPFKLFRLEEALTLHVVYCSLPGRVETKGDEYLNKEMFDTPLLHGYSWTALENISPRPSLDRAWGIINPSVVSHVRESDVIIVYGHRYWSCLLAIAAAKIFRKKLLLTTDAVSLGTPETSLLKKGMKRLAFPILYRVLADGVLVPSSATKRFIESLGVAPSRVFLTPYVVDNEGIRSRAQSPGRAELRRQWGIPDEARVLTFVSKFLPRKRPQDVLSAIAELNDPRYYAVLVGDGPLRASLEKQASALGISSRVRFLGFVRYSELAGVYAAGDLLVHPAEHEPYGLAVNEAMVCGCPAIVANSVGAGEDLVRDGISGFIYPTGDIAELTRRIRDSFENAGLLERMRKGALARIATWSSKENAEAVASASRAVLS